MLKRKAESISISFIFLVIRLYYPLCKITIQSVQYYNESCFCRTLARAVTERKGILQVFSQRPVRLNCTCLYRNSIKACKMQQVVTTKLQMLYFTVERKTRATGLQKTGSATYLSPRKFCAGRFQRAAKRLVVAMGKSGGAPSGDQRRTQFAVLLF